MDRLFSIRRRRKNVVDIMTPQAMNAGVVDEYRLGFALNFDAAFATFITAPNTGFYDSNIPRGKIETQPTTGKDVRIVFDPATYAINDNNPFWLQFTPVTDGVPGTPGAPTLVMPDAAHYGTNIITIKGEAPNGSTLQIDLPRRMQDFQVTNEDGANNLLVGTENGGPMTAFLPLVGTQSMGHLGALGSLWVEGVGGDVLFSASFTLAFPR